MRFLIDLIVIAVCGTLALYLYFTYWEDFKGMLFNVQDEQTVYIGSTAIAISVADEYDERVQGLSGVPSLREREGKLFIFDADGNHGIWMKEMRFPIDIIWIDKDLQVVHIAENVDPSTYPAIYSSPTPARFVLEMNAHFVSSFRIKQGDRLTLPATLLPADIKQNLQQ